MSASSDLTDGLLDDVSSLSGAGPDPDADDPDADDPDVNSVVVPDDALVRYARGNPVSPRVTTMITGGAGGLVALAERHVDDISVVAAEVMLRDLDDLAGAAARTIIAAEALPDSVEVYLGLPAVPGWQRAVDPIEAAGRFALVAMTDGPRVLAGQLAVLIEADLPFKIICGPGRGAEVSARGAVAAVHALVDGAEPEAAAELIMTVRGLSPDADAARIRRRLRRIDALDPGSARSLLGLEPDPG